MPNRLQNVVSALCKCLVFCHVCWLREREWEGQTACWHLPASVLFLCWKIGSSNVLIPNNVAGKPLEPNFLNPHSHTYIFELEKSMCATSWACVRVCVIGSQTNWTNGALSFYEWNSLAPLSTCPYPLHRSPPSSLELTAGTYALASFLLHGSPCTPLAVEETLAIYGLDWTPLFLFFSHWLLGVFRAHNTSPHSRTHTRCIVFPFSLVCVINGRRMGSTSSWKGQPNWMRHENFRAF